MWRVCKEAGRPWPVICADDPVIDYMIMEAVALKVRKQDREAEKTREREDFKRQKQQELKELVK
jgi:hypothetical protein